MPVSPATSTEAYKVLVRCLVAWCAVVSIWIVALLSRGTEHAVPATIRAEHFILMDSTGDERGDLSVNANDEAQLTLRDGSEITAGRLLCGMNCNSTASSAFLGVSYLQGESPGLSLRDTRHKMETFLTEGARGNAYLALFDGGHLALSVGTGANKVPGIRMYKNDKVIWSAIKDSTHVPPDVFP